MAKQNLVLLSGLLCDERLWKNQKASLADITDITVPNITKHEDIKELAKDILDNAPEKFSLAGLSMGGYTALEIMRQAPERVERLALIDTSAYADTETASNTRQTMIELAKRGKFESIITDLVINLIHPESDAVETFKEMARRNGADVFIKQQKVIMSRPDSMENLVSIKCPVAIICGRQDMATPVKIQEEFHSKIKNSKLVIIENCGHMSPIERPYAVSAALRYWLQD